jgi:ADP-ribose pyrophosphatase YjhB (NUDIX family)/3-deoxy-D-manno-octulosonate 8-phosphate phosphatase KdsC-like HAD superfamily phosphatase
MTSDYAFRAVLFDLDGTPGNTLTDRMGALLGDLRAHGVRLGLVTGKDLDSTRISLRQYGIENLFDVIAPCQAEALRDVLAAWQLRPEQALYVGDAPTQVDAARAVGMSVAPARSVDDLRDWLWPRLDAAPAPAGGWLRIAQRLQALAQAGLAYNPHVFDAERYEEVLALSHEMMAHLTGHPVDRLADAVALERGYPTPKVDIRAVLFRGTDEVLMVREKHDGGRWSLPGGWADVGCTPSEVAVKEVREETGLEAQAVRLLALWDKRVHPHPPQTWYVYKAFILCRPVGGTLLADTAETTEVRWVGRHELPGLEISVDRVTLSQLERLFAFAAEPNLPALCD